MAKTARRKVAAWKRPGSPIGRTGPRKAHPRYKRNMNKEWSAQEVRMLKELAKGNTPTGVISLKMGRTRIAIRGKAQREGISLMPANRSPYTRPAKTVRRAAASKRGAAKRSVKRTAARGRKRCT